MKTLIIITGPTGVGKTNIAIGVAQHLKTEIISADSRQFFKEIPIGTAAPTIEEQNAVPHHLIANLSIQEYYNAYKYEQDALDIITTLFKTHETVILTGGSGMYIDAVCNGIDEIPDIEPELRTKIIEQFQKQGIESLRTTLKKLDPQYYEIVDLKNPARLMRGIEVCIQTGKPYSKARTSIKKVRDFALIKIALNLPREELYTRINLRVDTMLEQGLENEVLSILPFREHTALKTVGYREFFDYFDGIYSKEFAIDKIKQNSRNYAKRQLSWFNRDYSYNWFSPHNFDEIISFVNKKISNSTI
jgi:tRNA dimethylallyltransferase